MKGNPDNTVILHWQECQTSWAQLSWRDWVRFRGFGEEGRSLLAGAAAGEHYFLVCILGERAPGSRFRRAGRGRARRIEQDRRAGIAQH